MYSVITIADEILKIAKEKGLALTPLQLMKLVYIAHGWSLGIRDEDLFEDRIEAWKYGPVIPALYQATKHFGREAIPFSRIENTPSAVNNETHQFLKDVVEKYGHLSGYSLSQLTHKVGTPWQQVYEDGVYGIEIPDYLIKEHYKSLFDARKFGSSAK